MKTKGKTDLTSSLDTLTLVALPSKTKTIKIPVKTEDDENEPIKRILNVNTLIAEVFMEMGYQPHSRTNQYVGSQYSLTDGFTGIGRRNLPVFKYSGTAFLEPDAMATVDKLFKVLTEKTPYPPHSSEAHICFTGQITKSFHAYVTRLKRDIDPKKLLLQTFERNGEIETLLLRSGVASLIIYDKSKELKKVPKKVKITGDTRKQYIQKFEAKYGSLENQTRIEFRFRSSSILKKFSELLQNGKHQEALEELLEQGLKRFELPQTLVKKLKKSLSSNNK